MKELILSKLKEIEEKEHVKIILAVESGSRAWGFSSVDSDYDVRFIYVRKVNDYLRLDKNRDVIEWQLDDVYDINGWDLQKALFLLYRSNPTLFEWASSPIVYKKTDEWKKIEKIMFTYFNPQKSLYHYINTAKKNYRSFDKKVKLKKYFYVLRPLFCCSYIIKNLTSPPVLFEQLDFGEINKEVKQLLERKKNSQESQVITRIAVIDDYIERSLQMYENTSLPSNKSNYKILDDLFLDIVLK